MIIWTLTVLWIFALRCMCGKLDCALKKKTFLMLVAGALIFVVGARYNDPTQRGDLNNYVRMYEKISSVSWRQIFSQYTNIEKGYILFNKICAVFFPWKQSIVFLEALICIGLCFRFIYKYCDDVFLAVLLYLVQGPFIFQLTGFRQAIAISLCLYSIDYVIERRMILFVSIIAIAMSFHTTAVIFLPMYLLARMNLNWKTSVVYILGYCILRGIAPALLLFGSDLTGSDYSRSASWGNMLGPLISVTINVVALVLLINEKGRYSAKFQHWKWNMICTGLLVYLLRFVSLPFERIAFYYMMGSSVVIPDALTDIFSKNSKNVVYFLFVVAIVVLFLFRINSSGHGEYAFFWM